MNVLTAAAHEAARGENAELRVDGETLTFRQGASEASSSRTNVVQHVTEMLWEAGVDFTEETFGGRVTVKWDGLDH